LEKCHFQMETRWSVVPGSNDSGFLLRGSGGYNTPAMRYLKYGILVLLLLQLPFIYQICKTGQVSDYVEDPPRQKFAPVPFQDLRGTMHVHSAAGGHSLGTYPEIIEAAKQAGYKYLFITEHPKEYQLFTRIEDPELVVIYGWESVGTLNGHTLEDDDSTVRIYTEFTGEDIPDKVTGIEIYSLDENARKANTVFNWFSWIFHQAIYPELFFFQVWEIDQKRIELWDKQLKIRSLPGFAGNDAHQNVGIVMKTTANQEIFSIMVDPYERSFRFVSNHVLIPPDTEITQDSILNALLEGSSYIAFDQIADPSGFSFHAVIDGSALPMGSVVFQSTQLVVQSSLLSRFKIFRSAEPYLELEGSHFEFDADEEGSYRVEVYPLGVPSLLEGKPWIISNPIYVVGTEEKGRHRAPDTGQGIKNKE